MIHGVIAGLICSLFPTPVRQSGFAFQYSFGTAIFSGLTPVVIASLVRSGGLGAPMRQELLWGAVAVLLAECVGFLPLRFVEEVAELSGLPEVAGSWGLMADTTP